MTPQRFSRLLTVLRARQPDLTVLMDNVNKAHNFSAILRSCDAVGVLDAHAIWPSERMRTHHLTSGGAAKWVKVHTHKNAHAALVSLRESNFQILAAHISRNACDFRDVDYTRPTAVVLGAELRGVSAPLVRGADQHVFISMHGMGESLNVSVAAATILFEAERQRRMAGMYAHCRIERSRFEQRLFEWAHPKLAALCQRRRAAYPALDEHGNVTGELPR